MVLQFVGEYVVAFLWNPSFLSWGSFFYWNDVFPATAGRFVAFASPVRLTPRVFENPVSNETGFFLSSPQPSPKERVTGRKLSGGKNGNGNVNINCNDKSKTITISISIKKAIAKSIAMAKAKQ